ncbi:glycosyl transferases group 1 family protein [Mycobacterium intracellulare 1956]|uniref:Glycosyl transferases group 1 family protein n=1 Tax=Mycobacterium intracellulare 1956 TaxID=1299331 RepID=X8CKY1_MYCIT|nr:glycosyl transferases group 1 family protein [Mycobacterium intracellulare 1956]
MKIAIVSGDDVVGEDPEQLGVALTAQGHDATVCFRRNGPRPAKATAGACRSVAVPVGPRAAADAIDVLPYVGDWAAKLERVWSKKQPDVVHAYGWLGGLAAQLAARRRRVPVVQTFLGLTAASRAHDAASARRSERQRIEPLLARSAAWATGESSAEVDMLAQLRHSRARVSALTCGVDSERYTPTGPEIARDGLQRILCVAPNPLQHNGFDIAISALSRVPGAEVVIAETEATNTVHDDARAQLQYLAKEFGVADRVRFAGTIPGKEMPMWVRSADIMVCTPREPLRPSTALQAMASGVVVGRRDRRRPRRRRPRRHHRRRTAARKSGRPGRRAETASRPALSVRKHGRGRAQPRTVTLRMGADRARRAECLPEPGRARPGIHRSVIDGGTVMQ